MFDRDLLNPTTQTAEPDATWAGAVGPKPTTKDPPGPEALAERFELAEVLGTGGFGVVYRAFDRTLGRDVAVKILRRDRASDQGVRRLLKEAQLARDVASPNLVRVFDAGQSGDESFLVLEYLPGGTLSDRIKAAPLDVAAAVRITDQLLAALEVLHAHGVVHRDIKPSNVLFDAAGVAKLGDFGLVRWDAEGLSRSLAKGDLIGTVHYVSPEHVRGTEAGPQSDLYSLGVTIFEALTGQLPFPASDYATSLLARVARNAPRLRGQRPDAPRWLDQVVARLLERDPRDRYLSAAAVRADLARQATRRFLLPRRPSLKYAGSVAGLLLCLFLSGGAWRWHQGRFSHFKVIDGRLGVRGIDHADRVLWELRPDEGFSSSRWKLARTTRGEPPRLLTFSEPTTHGPFGARLAVINPQTGLVMKTIDLAPRFEDSIVSRWQTTVANVEEMPHQFSSSEIEAVDLDGDGVEEVLFGVQHASTWPWLGFLWEPRVDRIRIVAVGAGHMGLGGVHDLDGDGTAELIYTGFNSVLGRYPSVLVHRMTVGVNQSQNLAGSSIGPTFAPGLGQWIRGPSLAERNGLMWSRLLPRGAIRYQNQSNQPWVRADPTARLLHVGYDERESVTLAFDGSSPSDPLGAAEARSARFEVLSHIENSRLLAGVQSWPGALAAVARARAAAALVADPVLVELCAREHASILVGAGDLAAAEELFRDLATDPEATDEIAYSAAYAYHLAGELDRAADWYRLGIGSPGHLRPGSRQRMYLLEGLVLLLAERGQWEEATTMAQRFGLAHSETKSRADLVGAWATFHGGTNNFEVPLAPPSPKELDSLRIFALELMAASGGTPEDLLRLAEDTISTSYEAKGAARIIRAELLAKAGSTNESREEAGRALAELRELAPVNAVARGFLAVMQPRAETLLEGGAQKGTS